MSGPAFRLERGPRVDHGPADAGEDEDHDEPEDPVGDLRRDGDRRARS